MKITIRIVCLPFLLTMTLTACQKYEMTRPQGKSTASKETADAGAQKDSSGTSNTDMKTPVGEGPVTNVLAPCSFTKNEGTLVY